MQVEPFAGRTICVSGYFDPLHVGHVAYLRLARQMVGSSGRLVVIVNNDRQAELKKGKPFMSCTERAEILRAIRFVSEVVVSVDQDRSVCKTLEIVRPDIFANGGDQYSACIPEASVCNEIGTRLLDGLGEKVQSSSWLLAASRHESC